MNSKLFWSISSLCSQGSLAVALTPALVQLALEPSIFLHLMGTGWNVVKYLTKKQKPQTIYIHERIVEDESEDAVLVSTLQT